MTTPIEPMEAVKVLQDAIRGMIPHADVVRAAQGYGALTATAHVEAPTSEPVAWRGDWLSVARKHGYAFPDARMQDFVAELLASSQALPATEQAKAEPDDKPTYDELEVMWLDQCRLTDKFAALAAEHGDPVLMARITDLEAALAKMNQRFIEAQASQEKPSRSLRERIASATSRNIGSPNKKGA